MTQFMLNRADAMSQLTKHGSFQVPTLKPRYRHEELDEALKIAVNVAQDMCLCSGKAAGELHGPECPQHYRLEVESK